MVSRNTWLYFSMDRMKSIFIITSEDYNWESSFPSVIGYVNTEEEAKQAVKELFEKQPKNPFGMGPINDKFEQAMCECQYDLDSYIDSLYEENPYRTPEGKVTMTPEWSKCNDEIEEKVKEAKLKWFKENTDYNEEDIKAYWEWEPYKYCDTHFSYEEIKPLNQFEF